VRYSVAIIFEGSPYAGIASWLRHRLAEPWWRLASRYRKRSARFWRPHDGDCAFWSGSLCCFARPSRTARYSGLAGQSPLPEKDPHGFGGRTMATALFARGKSVASCQYLGRITRGAHWDSRHYRKKIRSPLRRSLVNKTIQCPLKWLSLFSNHRLKSSLKGGSLRSGDPEKWHNCC
jgi:hypothetical protein